MIRSFKDKRTRSIDDGSIRKGFPADLVRRAQQLLALLDAAKGSERLAIAARKSAGESQWRSRRAVFNPDQYPMAHLFRMD